METIESTPPEPHRDAYLPLTLPAEPLLSELAADMPAEDAIPDPADERLSLAEVLARRHGARQIGPDVFAISVACIADLIDAAREVA